MAIVINGSGTVTGLAVGGLPDGTVDDGTVASGIASSKLTGALPAISGASLTNIPPQGRKNIIINGDFRINQRNLTASAVAVTNGAYNIDRMKNYLVGVSGTVALGDAEAVNGTYETPLKYTAGSTASGRIGGYQAVEDYHYGETLTASAWVKSDNANARIVAYDGSTNTSSNTHTGGGAWELLTVTFTQRANPDQLYIYTAIISATVGSVSIASGDYIYITKFQCERGSVATDFERLHKGEQLALCQRYYQRWGYNDVTSGTDIGALTMWNLSTTACSSVQQFTTTMRGSPSISVVGTPVNSSGGAVADLKYSIYFSGGWKGCSDISPNTVSKWGFRLDASTNDSMTSGGACGIYAGNGCYFKVDAEL